MVGQLLYKSTITLSSTNTLIHSDHHPAKHTVNNTTNINMETHNNTFKYWRRLKRNFTAVVRVYKTPLAFFFTFSQVGSVWELHLFYSLSKEQGGLQ